MPKSAPTTSSSNGSKPKHASNNWRRSWTVCAAADGNATPVREAGYTQGDIQELVTAAFDHLNGDPVQPYAFGHCTNCRKLIIGWSVYQWSSLVREPCPRCGKT